MHNVAMPESACPAIQQPLPALRVLKASMPDQRAVAKDPNGRLFSALVNAEYAHAHWVVLVRFGMLLLIIIIIVTVVGHRFGEWTSVVDVHNIYTGCACAEWNAAGAKQWQ